MRRAAPGKMPPSPSIFMSAAGSDLDDGHNSERGGVNDDDLVVVDEIFETTPLRVDYDQRFRNVDDPHRPRNDGAFPDGEVDAGHPRRIASPEHRLADRGS